MKNFNDCIKPEIESYLRRIGMQLSIVPEDEAIPGSFWGESEAGLIQNILHVRSDTPFHSILHESGHYICMTNARRKTLHTNAIGKTKGDYSEEDAVCFLQLLLADSFSFYSRAELFSDMDSWGYNFRLGSAEAWFEKDAEAAHAWLLKHGLITTDRQYLYCLRN